MSTGARRSSPPGDRCSRDHWRMPDGSNSLFTKIDHVGSGPRPGPRDRLLPRVFGVRSVHEETNAEQGVREATLAAGDGKACVQLLAPLNAESTIATFIDRNGPGVHRSRTRCADIDVVACAAPRERGVLAGVRRVPPRYGRLPDQLRPPEGRGRRTGRAGGTSR